jgi:demethylspheroidene O-methyltransferase
MGTRVAPAGPGVPRGAGEREADVPGWLERWRDFRNRLVGQPSFRRWAAAFAPTRPFARRDAAELFSLVAGFVYSQVLHAAVRLRVFDHLAEGPLPLAMLAERCGLPLPAAERLVAAASALALLERRTGDRVALGRLGAALVGNRAVTAMVEHHATLYEDLADPVALLRGQAHGEGRRPAMAAYWPYAAAGEDGQPPAELPPERVAEYSMLMSASQPLVAEEVLAAVDFRRHHTLLDVGGGEGTFLTAVAQHAPHLKLVLADLPAVVDRARQRFSACGLAERSEAQGLDFFADELPRGADIASLVRVCFDHPDERVLRLLQSVRRALPPDGTLVIAEPMAALPGVEAMGDAYFGFYLLAMGRGRPRTAAQFSRLLRAAGFDGGRRVATPMPLHTGVIVARCRVT